MSCMKILPSAVPASGNYFPNFVSVISNIDLGTSRVLFVLIGLLLLIHENYTTTTSSAVLIGNLIADKLGTVAFDAEYGLKDIGLTL